MNGAKEAKDMKDLTAGLHRHGISATRGLSPGFRDFILGIATESLKESISIPLGLSQCEMRITEPVECGMRNEPGKPETGDRKAESGKLESWSTGEGGMRDLATELREAMAFLN